MLGLLRSTRGGGGWVALPGREWPRDVGGQVCGAVPALETDREGGRDVDVGGTAPLLVDF